MSLASSHRARRPPLRGRIRRVRLPGYNLKFVHGGWLIKVCRHDDRVFDICEREEFVSTVGQALGMPVIDAWVRPLDAFEPNVSIDASRYVSDRCVVLPLLEARTVRDDTRRARAVVEADPGAVADIFAFMHWIGDEDRGLRDVLVHDGRLLLIDNGLCGPPGFESPLRGSHPFPGTIPPERAILKCFPRKRSLVAFVMRDVGIDMGALMAPGVVRRIEAMSEADLVACCRESGFPDRFAHALLHRRETLLGDYRGWLEAARELLHGHVRAR